MECGRILAKPRCLARIADPMSSEYPRYEENVCMTVVFSINQESNDLFRLRNTQCDCEPSTGSTVRQAALTTSAAQPSILSISLGVISQIWVDGGLRLDNPTRDV